MLLMPVLLMVTLIAELAPAPGPTVTPAPSTLKEIGRVQSLSVCSSIVVHANSAIREALDNDQNLGIAINRLQTTDIDGANEIERGHRMADLGTLASRVRLASAAGDREIKRLRDMANASPDPTRKAELKRFADALGGALFRQKRIALDLDRMLTIIDGRKAVSDANSDVGLVNVRRSVASNMGERQYKPSNPYPAVSPTPEPVNGVLRSVAEDFASRTTLVLSDEGIAADHTLGATTGC